MTIPVEPPSKNREEPTYRYVYSCPHCHVPQMAPVYEETPVIDKCINDDCDEFFVIPTLPARSEHITAYSEEEDAQQAYEKLIN